jgi:hypothetical protein
MPSLLLLVTPGLRMAVLSFNPLQMS